MPGIDSAAIAAVLIVKAGRVGTSGWIGAGIEDDVVDDRNIVIAAALPAHDPMPI